MRCRRFCLFTSVVLTFYQLTHAIPTVSATISATADTSTSSTTSATSKSQTLLPKAEAAMAEAAEALSHVAYSSTKHPTTANTIVAVLQGAEDALTHMVPSSTKAPTSTVGSSYGFHNKTIPADATNKELTCLPSAASRLSGYPTSLHCGLTAVDEGGTTRPVTESFHPAVFYAEVNGSQTLTISRVSLMSVGEIEVFDGSSTR